MNNFEREIKSVKEEIKKEPGKIFGLVYIYIFVIGLSLGIFYIKNINHIGVQNVPLAVPDTTKQEDLPVVEAKTIPPVDIMQVSQPTPELLTQGKDLFTRVCASCHGEGGQGNGSAAASLNPPPRNFTQSSGWKNGPTIQGMYQTLEEGIPGTGMISYNYLTPQERFGVIHYIRQTFVKNPPASTPDELTTLDMTYNLSKGKEVSAQIPIQAAMNIVIQENVNKVDNINKELQSILSDTTSEGAKIFNRVAVNKIKALAVFERSEEWKTDQKKFIDMVIYNTAFNANAYNLTGIEWDVLYNYIKGMVQP